MAFKIVPIDSTLARTLREQKIDAFGNALKATPAGNGKGPCRVCLQPFVPSDHRILLTYNPFSSQNTYTETGPVFIHENDCPSYEAKGEFPSAIAADPVNFPLTMRCYDHKERMIHAELINGRAVTDLIEKLLTDPKIIYIHARNAEYGCFIAKIERS